ncbi:MAG: sensor histidine kinase [Bacteroidia bacterium]
MPNTSLNKRELSYLIACVAITIIIIVFQLMTELNVVVAFATIAIVLATMYIPGKVYTYIFAFVASVLIAAGFYYSRFLDKTMDPAKFSNLAYNRISALLSVWITAYLILKFKQSRAKEQKSNMELIRQKELTRALEKEKELNELKSRFVAMASHEFRTPLSTILSSVALVEKYDSPAQKDDKKRHIDRIRSTVKNLNNILNDFLSLDKLEEGLVKINPCTFRLDEFFAEVMEEIKIMAKPGQQINFIYDTKLHEVVMDQNLLMNILNNLLNNAIKYSPENGLIDIIVSDTNSDRETARVTPANELVISVKDYGIGIPEEDKPFMFERFFRAGNASNIQGTGMGLNIVKRYLDLMGGSIDFTSETNKGTIFTVKIPLVK